MSAHDTPEVGSGETVSECRYPCDCGLFADEHCACMEGHPASPDPVQPTDAGGGLSEGERVDLSMAIIRAVYNGDGQVFYSVERILAAREAAWAEKYAAVVGERDTAEQERDDWRYCAEGLAARAESAEAALATALREKAEAWDEGWIASEKCEVPGEGMCGDCGLCNAPNPYRADRKSVQARS